LLSVRLNILLLKKPTVLYLIVVTRIFALNIDKLPAIGSSGAQKRTAGILIAHAVPVKNIVLHQDFIILS